MRRGIAATALLPTASVVAVFPPLRPLVASLKPRTDVFDTSLVKDFPVAVRIVPLDNLLAGPGLLNRPAGPVLTYLTVAVPFCARMMKGCFDGIPVDIDEAVTSCRVSPQAPPSPDHSSQAGKT